MLVSEKKRSAFEEVNQRQTEQLLEKEQKRLTTEGDLKIEREWRTSLKQLVDDQQEQLTALQLEIEEAKANCSDYYKLKKEFTLLQTKCSEYELSLEELGVQLRE